MSATLKSIDTDTPICEVDATLGGFVHLATREVFTGYAEQRLYLDPDEARELAAHLLAAADTADEVES